MLAPLQKLAIFLLSLGLERGQRVIELMDSDEIKAIASEMGKLTEISAEKQKIVWSEFEQLGYHNEMNCMEIISVIRMMFHGSKITEKSRNRFSR